MKHLILLAPLALALPSLAQDPNIKPVAPPQQTAPTPNAKFDWKLRLTKGQKWTQKITIKRTTTITAPSHPAPSISRESQSFELKQEVTEAWPTSYKIRATFARFNVGGSTTANGKTYPIVVPPKVLKALSGITFTMKQNADGEVAEISGLESVVAQIKTALLNNAKSAEERARMERAVPSVAAFRELVLKSSNNSQPKVPLAAGETYSYSEKTSLGAGYPDPLVSKVTGTLRSFDSEVAHFENSGNLLVSATHPIVVPGGKVYAAFTGTLAGPLDVEVESGLVLKGNLTMKLNGKTSAVMDNGEKETALITSTSLLAVETVW